MNLIPRILIALALLSSALFGDVLALSGRRGVNVGITAATNASPIVVTAAAHGYQTGHSVTIAGVLGNTAANGTFLVTRVSADTFSLIGSTGNGAYTSGGVATMPLSKAIVSTKNVSGATNASPIVITTSAAHGLETGDIVQIASVAGNTAANGQWVIAVASSTTFSLVNSAGNAAYTSGGTVAHLGYSWNSLADDTVFASSGATFKGFAAQVSQITSGSNVRVVVEDAADSSFVTAQPVAIWQANGELVLDRNFSIGKYDLPDLRIGASGNNLRFKVFCSGGAGKTSSVAAFANYN
jgi:hypothetical protein